MLTKIGFGPNPWKTVTVLEKLNVSYETVFLDFGAGENGVEGAAFKEKNPAGRVPLIYDPNTGDKLLSAPLKLPHRTEKSG
jgi:glutathione S-transferase